MLGIDARAPRANATSVMGRARGFARKSGAGEREREKVEGKAGRESYFHASQRW